MRSPSPAISDSIVAVIAREAPPVLGNEDGPHIFATIEWVPPVTATYQPHCHPIQTTRQWPAVLTRA